MIAGLPRRPAGDLGTSSAHDGTRAGSSGQKGERDTEFIQGLTSGHKAIIVDGQVTRRLGTAGGSPHVFKGPKQMSVRKSKNRKKQPLRRARYTTGN